MSRGLVIAIDCDDVLLPTTPHIVADYNRRFGTMVELKHMYKPVRPEIWGTDSDDVAIERVNEFLRTDAHARIKPFEEAVLAVKRLATDHELHLITGRADFLAELMKAFLATYFSGCFKSIEHTNYVIASTSNAVRRSKAELCQAVGANILIDDHLAHGHDALAGLEKVIIFGDYPWNQQAILPSGMVRCRDWSAVLEEVNGTVTRV